MNSVMNARELASMPVGDVWMSLPERLQIAFEDGVVIDTTKRETTFSHYFWEFHRKYPQTPLLSRHHVKHVLKGKPLNSNTHIELNGIIFKDVCESYQLHRPEEKEPLLDMIYDITNKVYNEVSKLAEEYVTSIDILDFIEVIEYPTIKTANENTEANHESIYRTYDVVLNTLQNDPNIAHNALARALRSKMVNANQVCQCVSNRGFLTEVDGSILPVPVMSNYTVGLKTLYNYVAESRSAAKALYFSEAPLQDAEYFARRLQLLSMVVEKIHYGDCGTQRYLEWRISPPRIDDKGNTVYPGDLAFMIGKYYLDEETNQFKEITHNDPALHNRVLKIRSVLFCQHTNPHEVCEVCFGGLSRNVSRFANLGHLCAATMTQQTSQSVLSTKHLDASSVSANISLGELASKYFMTNKEKNAYIVKKELKDKEVRLVVNRDEAMGLTDILNVDNVENINPIRVSSIECIDICFKTNGEELCLPIFVNQSNRRAVLTTEFLKYLKVHRWETDNRNNFVFNLVDWDFDLPILKLPDMEYSYSDHSHQIAKVIESNMKFITDRLNPHSPVSTLQELFGLVNTKLNVNIAALEVIIYANMIAGKDTYDLARNHPEPVLGISNLVIRNRSLSAGYAYEDQLQLITNPRSFFKLDRPSSVFDVFIAPFEVVQEEQRQRRL